MAVDREMEAKQKRENKKNGTTSNDDEEGDDLYEHSGESLLSLVQPELENLSRHWFSALKDHALLSLPAGNPGAGLTAEAK